MNEDASGSSAAPRRRGLFGLVLALLSMIGLRVAPPRSTRMVERDGWFLDETDR
jgi:hypothetical protein